MSPLFPAERTLTQLDYVRLTRLVVQSPVSDAAHGMQDVLEASELVPSAQVDARVVTMSTRVRLQPSRGGAPMVVTLCYPRDAQPAQGLVSVMSPLGCSLLGQRAGETVHWRTPAGEDRSAQILEIVFQPEATGDYTT